MYHVWLADHHQSSRRINPQGGAVQRGAFADILTWGPIHIMLGPYMAYPGCMNPCWAAASICA